MASHCTQSRLTSPDFAFFVRRHSRLGPLRRPRRTGPFCETCRERYKYSCSTAVCSTWYRIMAEAKTLYTFIVFSPDYTDPESLNRRQSVRAKHLENAKLIKAKGILRTLRLLRHSMGSWYTVFAGLGGALISPETYQTSEKKMIGSLGIYEAESLEAVKKVIEEDIYYTAGVVRPICTSRCSSVLMPELVGQGEDRHPAMGGCIPTPASHAGVRDVAHLRLKGMMSRFTRAHRVKVTTEIYVLFAISNLSDSYGCGFAVPFTIEPSDRDVYITFAKPKPKPKGGVRAGRHRG